MTTAAVASAGSGELTPATSATHRRDHGHKGSPPPATAAARQEGSDPRARGSSAPHHHRLHERGIWEGSPSPPPPRAGVTTSAAPATTAAYRRRACPTAIAAMTHEKEGEGGESIRARASHDLALEKREGEACGQSQERGEPGTTEPGWLPGTSHGARPVSSGKPLRP
jgi:hypothetical protein